MTAHNPADESHLGELASELRSLWHAMVRGVQQPEKLQGLQRQQFWVLGALAEGPRRMGDLAECAQTSQTSLTGIVDRLVEHGLVERTRSDQDRRVVEVGLTEAGRAQMAEANAAMLVRLESILEPLGPGDRSELLRLLRLIGSHGPGGGGTCGHRAT